MTRMPEATLADRKRQAAQLQQRERRLLWDSWRRAQGIDGTAAAGYLAHRGINRALPSPCPLRYFAALPYFADGRPSKLIHCGPAIIAAITRRATIVGLQLTYLDLTQPNGQALIIHPVTRELHQLKRLQGSHVGGAVELVSAHVPDRLILGKDIEVVLSVWYALTIAGWDLSKTAFWSSVTLDNISKIEIPRTVSEIILLGDGNTDAGHTRDALIRAAIRYSQPNRTIRIAWAPAGYDFNDVLRGYRPQNCGLPNTAGAAL